MNGSKAHWVFVNRVPLLIGLTLAAGFTLPPFHLVGLATFLLLILALPILRQRGIDWFSPWNLMFYSAIIGVFLRSIYITFDIPDSITIQKVFLLGQPKEFLLWPMIVVLFGMSLMTLGYLIGPSVPRAVSARVFQSDLWNERRFGVVTTAMIMISWTGFYLLVANTTGHIGIDSISAYRGVSTNLSEYRAYGYFRWMASFADLACYLLTARIISGHPFRVRYCVAFVLSLGTSVFFYFWVSSRGGIVFLFISLCAIIYYLRGKKLPFVQVTVAGIAGLFLMSVITVLRNGSVLSGQQNVDLVQALNTIVLNMNFIDVSKTAHIVASVPKNLDFQWGQTLVTVVFGWIPRELWPDKPVSNVDNIIGQSVFGSTFYGAGGVPPGLIAELYWNLWYGGVIAGCFAVGFFLKGVHTQFSAYSNNKNVVIIYVGSFMYLGLGLAGSSVSSVIMSSLMTLIPSVVILQYMTLRIRPRFEAG